MSENCKATASPDAGNLGNHKSELETVVLDCNRDDDENESIETCTSQPDLESHLESCIATILSESHVKTNRLAWPPLPVNPDAGWNIFPPWIAVSIVILSIVGILGAIFELRYQFHGEN